MIVSFALVTFAEDGAESGSLKIVNYNVDGLPIPKFLSSVRRDPRASTKLMPEKLNSVGADLIAVQEDFNYHSILKRGIDMPYKTYHFGGIPFGDGLNFFSKYQLYNIKRVPWETSYGIFDNGSDELTPKGFICGSLEIAEGVYIDVYNIHADAYGGEGNAAARAAEYRQLLKFIEGYSKDHAVIVLGDINTRFMHTESELKKQFIDEAGFRDVWVELKNGGNYDIKYSDNDIWGIEYMGIWDSLEKTLYRSGGGVSFKAFSHEFAPFKDDDGNMLSDHSAEITVINYTIDRNAVPKDERTYEKERYEPFKTLFLHIKYFFKALGLVLGELPKLISGEIIIKFQ